MVWTMSDNRIATNLSAVRNDIADACRRCGREPGTVNLLAVSKHHLVECIKAAYAAGQRDFGENYAQEFAAKLSTLGSELPAARFHYIGHLQSNKTRLVAGRCTLIHTVDRAKIMRYINRYACQLGVVQPVLFEVHLSPEESKAGCLPEALPNLLEEALSLPGIEPRGLMTMPPWDLEPEEARPYFKHLRELRDDLATRFNLTDFTHLSMGMSHDFPIAIEEGATIVRIGTAIFGDRIRS